MNNIQLEWITMAAGIALVFIGLWGILTQKSILKIIVGFSLFDTGTHVILVSIGYIKNRTAPILDEAVDASQAASQVVDPVPQSLVLTAIVIGLGITALMLSFALQLNRKNQSSVISNLKDLKW